jgi:hypothetical protein
MIKKEIRIDDHISVSDSIRVTVTRRVIIPSNFVNRI